MEVRPRHELDTCQHSYGLDAAAIPVRCDGPAAIRLDGVPYCYRHADRIMADYCQRPVKIERA